MSEQMNPAWTPEQAEEARDMLDAMRGNGALGTLVQFPFEAVQLLVVEVITLRQSLREARAERDARDKALDDMRSSWLKAGEESVHWMKRTEEEARRASDAFADLSAARTRIAELEGALRDVESQCAGHADEFSGNVARICRAALAARPKRTDTAESPSATCVCAIENHNDLPDGRCTACGRPSATPSIGPADLKEPTT